MESCCPSSIGRGRLVAGLGPSSAIADVVAGPGGSQLTIAARTVYFLLVGLPPGMSVTVDISIISYW